MDIQFQDLSGSLFTYIPVIHTYQGIRKRWMQGFLPKKSPSIFSCLDLILWPNVSNIFGDDFVPHHLVFYEIF